MTRPADAKSQSRQRPQTAGYASGSEQPQASGDPTLPNPGSHPETKHSKPSSGSSSFNNHSSGLQFNAPGGTQNSNTGSGNQFTAANFHGPVNFGRNFVEQVETDEIALLKCLHESTSMSDCESNRDYNSSRLVEGTCQWFLNDNTYKSWLEKATPSVLLVSAGPGSGKSVLATFLIDKLRGSRSNADPTVCCFFFKDGNYKLNTATSALSALLLQLFDEEPCLLVHAMKEYRIKGQKFTEDFGTLQKIFTKAAENHCRDKVICVIDGLDECEDSDRNLLVRHLARLDSGPLRTNTQRTTMKFIVTSRWYGWIEREFPPSSIIRPNADAISKDVAVVVDSEIRNLGSKRKLSIDLQNELKKHLVSNADQTFLWVSLILDQFKTSKDFEGTEEQCWERVKNLPPDLDAAYERILKQSTNPKRAKKILHIIVAAARPLTPTEMDIALAIDREHKSIEDLKPSRLPSIECSIRDVCGGLVKVVGSQRNQKIDLVHHTAKEFLVRRSYNVMPCQGFWTLIVWAIYSVYQTIHDFIARSLGLWKHSLEPVESNRVLAEICISYLLFEEFSSSPLVMDSEAKALDILGTVDRYTNKHEFLDYAAKHWANHLKETETGKETALLKSGLEVCNADSTRFLTWFQVYWTTVDSLWLCPKNFTNLMVWSYFGHEAIVRLLLKKGANVAAEDDGGKTALHWAVENGHKSVAQTLWESGANVDVKDTNGWTALHIAAAKGHQGLAELLLVKGANVATFTNRGQAALHLAAGNGHKELARLLLNCGTNVNMKTNILEYTALHLAARNGHKEVAQLLLDDRADVNMKTATIGEYMAEYTALHLAATDGHTEVAELLLDRRGNPAAADKMGETPLHKAAKKGHAAVASLLLEKNADITAKDKSGETPLHKAAKKGHAAVASLLLDGNANVAAKDSNGAIALHYAAANGRDTVAQLLVEKKVADVAAKDNDGKTALHYAARSPDEVVARLLIEQGGASIAATDNDGKTALHHATANGRQKMVQLLVEKGANICAEDNSGKTALHYAAANGREAAVKLLLTNDRVNVNARDKDSRTPLCWAADNGHEAVERQLVEKEFDPELKDEGYHNIQLSIAARYGLKAVVRRLLDKGANLESKDKYGRTPLLRAAENGHEAVVRQLLDKGADLESKDEFSNTPLWQAAKNGCEAVILQLLEKGADFESKDKFSNTLLSWVAGNGHEVVVRQLVEKGADLESKGNYGQTPLSGAAANGHEVVVRQLVEKGADLESKDNYGQTPLSRAAANWRDVVVRQLLEKGADLESKDNYGQTPLWHAAANGVEVVVRQLVEKGADLESKDNYGRTPLSQAAANGHEAVVRLLQ
ncbi:hypothetical protein DL771_008492 [Monosporascus sp. 5C6A]|nr:hypothetical protein DL771_008492 [Monosporascus sp. 5C6A]